MGRKLTYYGEVKEGVIRLPKRIRKEVTEHLSGKIKVTFEKKRKGRSNEQNRYYWGVVIPYVVRGLIEIGENDLIEGSKEDAELIHQFLKRRFIADKKQIVDREGNVYELDPSTTDRTTIEMEEYLDRVRQFAAEYLGVTIPLPNEQLSAW